MLIHHSHVQRPHLPYFSSLKPTMNLHHLYGALDQQVIKYNKACFLSGHTHKKIPLIMVHDYSKPNVQIVVGNDA